MSNPFFDGLKSMVSTLINRRTATQQNAFEHVYLSHRDLETLYKTGVGNKIVRLKAGHALKDSIAFESTADEEFYKKRLAKHVKKSVSWMIASGRGIIVLHERGAELSRPLASSELSDPDRLSISSFGGTIVTVNSHNPDLESSRYLKPDIYNVRGQPIHWSRVIDFTYVEPPEMEKPIYRYGGISEFELIYEQLVADGVVQRASPRVIEKASRLFYKVTGFKDAMRTGRETEMIQYFERMEDINGIFSAGLVDAEDQVEVVNQTISNLAEADQITLRRLAMVTGIPLAMLVGENVKGLNSTGDNERAVFQDMIEALQSDYIDEPLNDLMRKLSLGVAKFKDNQGETALDRIEYETKAIDNAVKLASIGEDYQAYLEDKDIVTPDDFSKIFTDEGSHLGETSDNSE